MSNEKHYHVQRLSDREFSDRNAINEFLDNEFLAHVGFVESSTQEPFVIPMGYARDGDRILLHGSTGSRMMMQIAAGAQICVTITQVNGLIAARSTFNSSMAYRSVSVFGPARLLDGEEKEAALEKLINGIIPGRSSEVRPSSESEISRTSVLEVTIEEASAKISVGPPDDDDEDVEGPAWAGVIPFRMIAEEPIPAPDGAVGAGTVPVPASVRRYRERGS